MTLHDAIQPSLAPSSQLNAMNHVMLGCVTASLDGVRGLTSFQVRLFEWVRQQVTLATTSSGYGPCNPYKDPAVEAAFR
jgi:hypothetical protein